MKTYSLKRLSVPKIAVLATGLTAAILVGTVNMLPAQAFPTKAAACTGCHTAGGTTTAKPSSATPAAGAAYTVAITLTANPGGGNSGYAIVPVAPATEKTNGGNTGADLTFSAAMTAPAAAGTYSYTVWTNQGATDAGSASSASYSITVGSGPTTPPVTTPPVTTPPVTTPPVTTPPVTTPPVTTPPVTTPPVTTPPVILPPVVVNVSGDLSPSSALGKKHLSMYNLKSANCSVCHDGAMMPAPPTISGKRVDMKPGLSCRTCHASRGREDAVFVSLMNDKAKVVYDRCSDCHAVKSTGGSHDGDDGDDDGHDGGHDGGHGGWDGDDGGWGR